MNNPFLNKKKLEYKFWEWFRSKSDDYFLYIESRQDELLPILDNELHKIDKNLTYQFSKIKEDGKRDFIISADGIKESIPSVLRLVEAAPKLDKWKVLAFRQRQDELPIVQMENFKVDPDDIYFKIENEGNRIHLVLFVRNYIEKREYLGAIFIIIDGALGEYDAMTKIDSLDVKMLDETKMNELKSLKELPKLIDSKKRNNIN